MIDYKQEVIKYGKSLPEAQSKSLLSAVKALRKDGYDYEWIYTALTHKKKEAWNAWGYGLLMNWSFRVQITKKVKHKKECENSSWDDL